MPSLHVQKTSLAGDLCKRTMAIFALLQPRVFERFDGFGAGLARGGFRLHRAKVHLEGIQTKRCDGFRVSDFVAKSRSAGGGPAPTGHHQSLPELRTEGDHASSVEVTRAQGGFV